MAKKVKVRSPYLVSAKGKVRLERIPAGLTSGKESNADKRVAEHQARMNALQEKMYASAERSLLIVLQGMDTAGKDGAVQHIFGGVNPQGCYVHSFKVPSALELSHDYLWRIHANVPAKGMIGIFNRSQYEDVLSPVVHGVIDAKTAKRRFEEINQFEETLAANGTTILKFFLHISKDEQKRRLQARLDDAAKHWKLSAGDFAERKFWPAYVSAYEDILENTSTAHAPWFVIPSNHKWYRNVAISEIVVDAMEHMKLKFPTVKVDLSKLKL